MAIRVGSFDAKNQLSELLRKVQAGEEVIIMRHNQPLARLVPWEEKKGRKGIVKAFSVLKQLRQKNQVSTSQLGGRSA